MNVSQQRSDPSRQQQDRYGVEGGQGRRHLNGTLKDEQATHSEAVMGSKGNTHAEHNC